MSDQDITLRDVVNHMSHGFSSVKNELRNEMRVGFDKLDKRVGNLEQDVSVLKHDVSVLKEDVGIMKRKQEMLIEDTAVIASDTVEIKEHVGMSTSSY